MDHPVTRCDVRATRFKTLHRKLEGALAHIERIDNMSKMLEAILEHLCREFEDDLGFQGGGSRLQ